MNDLERIVTGGYCIGCGACSLATDGAVPIGMNEFGQYQANGDSVRNLTSENLKQVLNACPFSDEGPNENAIGKELYGEICSHDQSLGYYKDLGIGHVSEDNFRAIGTSGGIITWVLSELLKLGLIDAVIHVKKVTSPTDGVLFRYGISHTEEEIKAGAKSRYYPIEMSEVLRQIKQTPGRYAVVGLPCFIKAVRRLAASDSVIKERVAFCVGLVCGHLKSKAFGDCFGWQVGIPPGQLEEIDFRVKFPNRSAGDYGVYLRGGGKEMTCPTKELFGSKWGLNFFRYSACDYCDDVFAETADIAIGDAWLSEYTGDSEGNSVVIVRNHALSNILATARSEQRLNLMCADPKKIASSQAGGLRDRREGVAYRLYLKQRENKWTPTKRVKPANYNLSARRAKIYELRSKSGKVSHMVWREAVTRNDFERFKVQMNPVVRRFQKLYRPFWRRIASGLKRRVMCLIGVWR